MAQVKISERNERDQKLLKKINITINILKYFFTIQLKISICNNLYAEYIMRSAGLEKHKL